MCVCWFSGDLFVNCWARWAFEGLCFIFRRCYFQFFLRWPPKENYFSRLLIAAKVRRSARWLLHGRETTYELTVLCLVELSNIAQCVGEVLPEASTLNNLLTSSFPDSLTWENLHLEPAGQTSYRRWGRGSSDEQGPAEVFCYGDKMDAFETSAGSGEFHPLESRVFGKSLREPEGFRCMSQLFVFFPVKKAG